MKKFALYLFAITLLIINACDDNTGGGGSLTDPLGGGLGGGNSGSVSFTIGKITVQEGYDFDQDGQADESFYLTAKPSVSIKITKVDIQIPGNASFDSVEGDGTSVFNANVEVQINSTPYFNVTRGQKFTLKFTGKLAANDQAFEISVEYTVP